jgi:hypothetical protein
MGFFNRLEAKNLLGALFTRDSVASQVDKIQQSCLDIALSHLLRNPDYELSQQVLNLSCDYQYYHLTLQSRLYQSTLGTTSKYTPQPGSNFFRTCPPISFRLSYQSRLINACKKYPLHDPIAMTNYL